MNRVQMTKWREYLCEMIPCDTYKYCIQSWSFQGRVSQRRIDYQSNSSSLEDQGCLSMDSLENEALHPDRMENQSFHSTVSNTSKSSFENVCSPRDISEGCSTPTNYLEKRESSSSKTEESDSDVSGLDLVRTILQLSKNIWIHFSFCSYRRWNSFLRWT